MPKVIVFESEKTLADTLVAEFRNAGFDVVWFEFPPTDTASAVAYERPDAITMDIVMRNMDGFRATYHIKQDPKTKGVPLVFYSNLTSSENVERGMALGAAAYVKKTICTPRDLVHEVQRILNIAPRID